jgi:2-oxoglutarate dehydrogenase E2 component (dihydrolipoamide succinyltransferase)
VELKAPSLGESVAEVEIAEWLKKEGDTVKLDEDIVVLDSAKTSQPIPSPASGTLSKILKQQGEVVAVGDVIAILEDGVAQPTTEAKAPSEPAPEWEKKDEQAQEPKSSAAEPSPVPLKAPQPKAEGAPALSPQDSSKSNEAQPLGSAAQSGTGAFVMPAAQRELAQSGISPEAVTPSGPGGRILKEDVQRAAAESVTGERDAPKVAPMPQATPQAVPQPPKLKPAPQAPAEGGEEEVVPMTMLRRHIAQRLVEAQQTAALLTTFNEIDMSQAMALRKQYQDEFSKKYGIKLGFMSFFVKAAVDALKQFPVVNAEIRGRDIVYKNYYDIGVAIGSGKGLVVPVVRRAERMSFAEIEQGIAELANRAKASTLKPDDLEGGTFTITNGGIYGSLMSTPIVNTPQSAILGMHSIQERPIAVNGQMEIRPMMYVALTYDHRLIDGREAVSFLVRIKQCIENPARMLLEV